MQYLYLYAVNFVVCSKNMHESLHKSKRCTKFAGVKGINIRMKTKIRRLEAIKLLVSSKQIGSQDELLQELHSEGFKLTQATLSRDLKQLKVAKAASMNGHYMYVLPNETMYKRIHTPLKASEMMNSSGIQSIEFSGNMGVIHTRPGYASSVAYNIDNARIPEIMGTIAGDDTIFIVIREDAEHGAVVRAIGDNVIL